MDRSPEERPRPGTVALLERRAAFFLGLSGICVLAVALRLPGLQWLQAVTPYDVFDFHPDVMRFVRPTEDFSRIGGWRGYPVGLTAQLYVVRRALTGLGLYVDPVLLIRGISLSYGVLTVFLVGVIARALSASAVVGLLAALFLALSPMHIINSHFGTADSALVFFLYVALVFGWRALEGRSDLDFVLFVASVGVALAVKFFLPLLAPLAIVVWHQERRVAKALEASLLLAGSFAAANFFNYTPWDLSNLFEMIREENVAVAGGLSPPEQLARYVWDTPRAMGLAVWLLFVVGLVSVARRAWGQRSSLPALRPAAWYSATRSPYVIPVSALGVHFASLIAAGFHAPRHLLPFLPVMCLLAAVGLVRASSRRVYAKSLISGLLVAVVGYQVYNAIGVEARYAHDVRHQLAAEVSRVASPGEQVTSFHAYSQVRGATLVPDREDGAAGIESEFFVTCGARERNDASGVFHAYQERVRPDFYRELFAGRLGYHLIYEVSRDDFTLEQRLASRGLLPRLGTFTPSRCVIFAREDVAADR